MHRSLYCYPWDLAEYPVADFCAKLQQQQFNAMTLACSYHAGKFLRPQHKTSKIIFPEDGTVNFCADLSRYGELKPQISSLTREKDILKNYCQQKNIAVYAWMVLLHNSRLGMLHPETTVRNAFGDRYIYSLCPNHPSVREYALQLCSDIAEHYPIQGMALETPGFLPFEHGYHHEFAQVAMNPWLSAWLGLCFCDYCLQGMQQKNIDGKKIQQQIIERINHYLQSAVELSCDMAKAWLLADCCQDAELIALLHWRCAQVAKLIENIRAAVRRDCIISVIPTVQSPHATAFFEGSDLMSLSQHADYLECPFYRKDIASCVADAVDVIHRVGNVKKIRAILRPGFPDMSSAQQVQETVQQLHQLGVKGFSFYNFGLLRPHNLQWATQALRGINE